MAILEVFPLGPYDTNAILLACPETKQAVIIDAPSGSAKVMLERLEALGATAIMVLFTHSHWDHIADASLLKEKLNVPLLIHKEDAANLEQPGKDGIPYDIAITGVKADGFLTEGQKIQVGELEIEVIHTPGHSPGCVCFYLEKEKLLISGDTLFRGMIGNLSLPTSRPHLMHESLQKLSKLPDETIVVPGHGGKTTIGREKQVLIRRHLL